MTPTQRFTILLVDDEPAQRTVLAGYLRKQRHVIHEAGSVSEALDRIRKESVDIILTDFTMPGHTGLDLLREQLLERDSFDGRVTIGYAHA